MRAETEQRPRVDTGGAAKNTGEAFGTSIANTADRPSWDTLVEATVDAQIIGFELGYRRGWADALDDREAHLRQVRAGRSAGDHLDVHLAREKAAARRSA